MPQREPRISVGCPRDPETGERYDSSWCNPQGSQALQGSHGGGASPQEFNPLPRNADGTLQGANRFGPMAIAGVPQLQPSPAAARMRGEMSRFRQWDTECDSFVQYSRWARNLMQSAVRNAREALDTRNWEQTGRELDIAFRAYQATHYGAHELIRRNSGQIRIAPRTTAVNQDIAAAEGLFLEMNELNNRYIDESIRSFEEEIARRIPEMSQEHPTDSVCHECDYLMGLQQKFEAIHPNRDDLRTASMRVRLQNLIDDTGQRTARWTRKFRVNTYFFTYTNSDRNIPQNNEELASLIYLARSSVTLSREASLRILDQPIVSARVERLAAEQIREQLQASQIAIDRMETLAPEAQGEEFHAITIAARVATTTAHFIFNYLHGLQEGFPEGFNGNLIQVADFFQAVYQNPAVLTSMAANVIEAWGSQVHGVMQAVTDRDLVSRWGILVNQTMNLLTQGVRSAEVLEALGHIQRSLEEAGRQLAEQGGYDLGREHGREAGNIAFVVAALELGGLGVRAVGQAAAVEGADLALEARAIGQNGVAREGRIVLETIEEEQILAEDNLRDLVVSDQLNQGVLDSARRNAARWGHWSDLERVTVNGREYAPINNRLFTQHAVEHLAPRGLGSAAGPNPVLGRGVPPGVVEDVITNGQLVNEAVAGSGAMRQTWLRDGVQVITEQAGQIVVTVMRVGGQ